ncbi:MAG: leucine-rich repeat protein [Eubacterium sp.]|nr:leucine-rich repeat protein [Eubacterium sp.]
MKNWIKTWKKQLAFLLALVVLVGICQPAGTARAAFSMRVYVPRRVLHYAKTGNLVYTKFGDGEMIASYYASEVGGLSLTEDQVGFDSGNNNYIKLDGNISIQNINTFYIDKEGRLVINDQTLPTFEVSGANFIKPLGYIIYLIKDKYINKTLATLTPESFMASLDSSLFQSGEGIAIGIIMPDLIKNSFYFQGGKLKKDIRTQVYFPLYVKGSQVIDPDEGGGFYHEARNFNQVDELYNAEGYYYKNRPRTAPVPERVGYDFQGWSLTDEGMILTRDEFLEASNSGVDQKFLANWKAKTYEVSLQTNGGSCQRQSCQVDFDHAYGNLPVPEKKGYEFAGWYTKKTGGELITSTSICKTPGDHSLYALWKTKQYTVTCTDYLETGEILGKSEWQADYQTKQSGASAGQDLMIGKYYKETQYLSDTTAVVDDTGCQVSRVFISYEGSGLDGSYLQDQVLTKAGEKVSEVRLPEEVKAIGPKAFDNCQKMKTITLPYSVEAIGEEAFATANNLQEIVVKNPHCRFEGSHICKSTCKLVGFSGSTTEAYARSHQIMFEPIQVIGKDFYQNEGEIKEISLPQDVKEIQEGAFKNCTSLEKIDLGGVEKIADGAFQSTGLERVVMPEGLKEIGQAAFADCPNLKEVDFSACKEDVKIGDYCFWNDGALERLIEGQGELLDLVRTSIPEHTILICYAGSRLAHFADLYNRPCILIFGQGKEKSTSLGLGGLRVSNLQGLILGQAVDQIESDAFSETKTLPQGIVVKNPNCKIPDQRRFFPEETPLTSWSKSSLKDYCSQYEMTMNKLGESNQIQARDQDQIVAHFYAYVGMPMPRLPILTKDKHTFLGYGLGEEVYYDIHGRCLMDCWEGPDDLTGDHCLQVLWQSNETGENPVPSASPEAGEKPTPNPENPGEKSGESTKVEQSKTANPSVQRAKSGQENSRQDQDQSKIVITFSDVARNDGANVGGLVKKKKGITYCLYKASYTASVLSVSSKKKKIKIGNTVSYKGRKYKITGLEEGAMRKNKRVKSLTLGKHINRLGRKCFYKCSKLKKIRIYSRKIKKIGKKCFQGIGKRCQIYLPKKVKSKYKKLFRKKGQGKKVAIRFI